MAEPTYVFDRESVRAVDQTAIEEYGIPGIVLMENAARGLADEVVKALETQVNSDHNVLIICGSGNNGGDGCALARHLHNRGMRVTIASLGKPREGSDAATNRTIARTMEIPEVAIESIDDIEQVISADLIVDAIFGTGLDRTVSGKAADVIRWMNSQDAPVVAVDVPSGLDCNTGEPLGVAVRAAKTATFIGQKIGFENIAAKEYVGVVAVVDIGVPIELIERFGTQRSEIAR